MSKIAEALKKVQGIQGMKEREPDGMLPLEDDFPIQDMPISPIPKVSGGFVFPLGIKNFAVIFIVSLVGFASVMISFGAVSALRKSNAISASIVRSLAEQQSEINHLKVLLSETEIRKSAGIQALEQQIKDLKISLERSEKNVFDVKNKQNLMRVSLKGLTDTKEEWTKQFNTLSQELRATIKKSESYSDGTIQELLNQYKELRQELKEAIKSNEKDLGRIQAEYEKLAVWLNYLNGKVKR
ncbi:MAG: hypothetical protein WC552_06300 [Candidatus Omnitrophota bacterium]